MILAEKIDHSALLLADGLRPHELDRTLYMPVAAIAVWSTSRGTVALQGTRGEHGQRFPVGDEELPEMYGTPEELRAQVAASIEPLLQALQVQPWLVLRVSGLLAHDSVAGSYIFGGASPDGLRARKIMPLRVDVKNCPQILGSWHPPTEASNQVRAQANRFERTVGAIMLHRSRSARPTDSALSKLQPLPD